MALSSLLQLLALLGGQTLPPSLFELPKPKPDAVQKELQAAELEISRGHPSKKLTLSECLALGEANQPRILAACASLRAAQAASAGLHSLRGIARLAPDLAARKQQSAHGLEIAQAMLTQEIEDTKYAIRRAYFTAIYAGIQGDRLKKLATAMDRTSREINKDLARAAVLELSGVNTRVRLALAETGNQLAVAEIGRLKARLLLAEEMGGLTAVQCFPDPADEVLLRPKVDVTMDQLESLVAEHRGQRILARSAREVAQLEVEAQRASSRFAIINRTFAAFTDNGVNPVPTPERGTEFKPGAISLEMSTFMGGPKPFRIMRSEALADRAEMTELTTTNLTNLEARVVYLNHKEVERRLEANRSAIEDARSIFRRTTSSTIRVYDIDVLPKVVVLLVDYEMLRLERALIAAEMMRITGGALEIPFYLPGEFPRETKPEQSTDPFHLPPPGNP